jgi:hypothetical protein
MTIPDAEPAHTYALVVGIEQYSAGSDWDLNGPARDVHDFTRWLLRRQIPEDNILLFVSALDKNKALISGLGMATSPATRENIYNAITQDLRSKDGNLLFFFWSGHGVVAQDSRRLFYADTTQDTLLNLDLTTLLNSLRSSYFLGFPQQIGFVDTCANYVLAGDLLNTLPLDVLPYGLRYTPHEQIIILAASDGELAKNDDTKHIGHFSAAATGELEELSVSGWPPDIHLLIKKLQTRFAELRASGNTQQTPTYLWYRGSGGAVGDIGRIPGQSAGYGVDQHKGPDIVRGYKPFRVVQREALLLRHSLLVQQYHAANNQLLRVLSDADGIKIQYHLQQLSSEIQDLEKQIKGLE